MGLSHGNYIDSTKGGKVDGWKAYKGNIIEIWKAEGRQFVELDATGAKDYGVSKDLTGITAGTYLMLWDEMGRSAGKVDGNAYTVMVGYGPHPAKAPKNNETVDNIIAHWNTDKALATNDWNHKAWSFSITPEQLAAANNNGGLWLAFVPDENSLNSYGTLISEVRLTPIEIVVLDQDDSNHSQLRGSPSDLPVEDGLVSDSVVRTAAVVPIDPDPEFVTTQFKPTAELKVVKFEDSLGEGAIPAITFQREPDHFRIRLSGDAFKDMKNCFVAVQSSDNSGLPDTTAKTSQLKWNAYHTCLLSEPMRLVSDYDDRNEARDDKFNLLRNRVIVVSAGGKVDIKSITLNGIKHDLMMSVPLKKLKKTIPVTVKILSNSGGDNVDATNVLALAMEDINRANERLLQVGIQIDATPQIIPAPPALQGGPIISWAAHGTAGVSDDEKSVSALGTPGNAEDIVVFYVYGIKEEGTTTEVSGIARHTGAAAYINNAYVSFHRHKPYTLAHELVHLFTKRGHYAGVEPGDYPPEGPRLQHKIEHNLMVNGTDVGLGITSSKRLYRAQEITIGNVLKLPAN